MAPFTQETVVLSLQWLAVLGVVDLLGVRKSPGARYFILHVLANIIVVHVVWRDTFALLAHPLDGDATMSGDPLPVVYAIHLYHVLFFRNLTFIDWMHHLINVLIMGIIGHSWDWGKGINATSFFMNGVPGGINYAMLAMLKHGLIDRMTEKHWNCYLNMCLRLPGMTIVAYIMVANKIAGHLQAPWWVIGVIILLEWGNAAYFAQRVVGNYHINKWGRPRQTPQNATEDGLKKSI